MKKPSKYKNKKTVIDGIKFDSIAEGRYYLKLKEDKKRGLIKDFELQPEYELQEKFKNYDGKAIGAIKLRADFLVIYKSGVDVVIDIKGLPTPAARLKRKLFEFKYPEKRLLWLCWDKNYGWIDYDKLKKRSKNGK